MIIVKWLEIYERRLMAWGEGKGRDGAFVSMIEARFGTLLVLTESVLTRYALRFFRFGISLSLN
jgi:hypothetical protein